MLARLIPFSGRQVMTNTSAVEPTAKGLRVKDGKAGEEREVEADTVILAVGFRSDSPV